MSKQKQDEATCHCEYKEIDPRDKCVGKVQHQKVEQCFVVNLFS